jgi:hypothetical protein
LRLWPSGRFRVSLAHLRRGLASTGFVQPAEGRFHEAERSASLGLGPPGRRPLWLAARSSPEHVPVGVRLRRNRAGSLCTRPDEDGSLVGTLSSLQAGPRGQRAGAVRCAFGWGFAPAGNAPMGCVQRPRSGEGQLRSGTSGKQTGPSGSGRFPGPASRPGPKGTFGFPQARAGRGRCRATGARLGRDRQGLWFRPSWRLSGSGLDCPAGAPRSV